MHTGRPPDAAVVREPPCGIVWFRKGVCYGMWRRKLGLGLSDSFRLSVPEQLQAFALVGFDAFFSDDNDPEQRALPAEELARRGRECGLMYQSIHAPFKKAADLWQEDAAAGDAAVQELLDSLERCRRAEVPLLVLHAFIGFDEHTPNERGIERFGRVVQAAQGTGVRLAVENTEGEEYLFALLDAFRGDDTVGFCWDSGHEMCYNHSRDLLARYGDRLLATHINDNLGIRDFAGKTTWIDDLHLLPFDGIADWDYNAARLRRCGCPEVLTFELTTRSKPNRRENDGYARMEPEDYLTEAYKRACRVAAKIHKAT